MFVFVVLKNEETVPFYRKDFPKAVNAVASLISVKYYFRTVLRKVFKLEHVTGNIGRGVVTDYRKSDE